MKINGIRAGENQVANTSCLCWCFALITNYSPFRSIVSWSRDSICQKNGVAQIIVDVILCLLSRVGIHSLHATSHTNPLPTTRVMSGGNSGLKFFSLYNMAILITDNHLNAILTTSHFSQDLNILHQPQMNYCQPRFLFRQLEEPILHIFYSTHAQ